MKYLFIIIYEVKGKQNVRTIATINYYYYHYYYNK